MSITRRSNWDPIENCSSILFILPIFASSSLTFVYTRSPTSQLFLFGPSQPPSTTAVTTAISELHSLTTFQIFSCGSISSPLRTLTLVLSCCSKPYNCQRKTCSYAALAHTRVLPSPDPYFPYCCFADIIRATRCYGSDRTCRSVEWKLRIRQPLPRPRRL